MKASVYGVPQLSILDGWWIEGYNGKNGWAFSGADDGLQRDAKDAASIYALLEKDIVPLYYNLGEDGIPHGWVTVMKEAIRMNGPNFSATRMAKEYTDKFYRQAIDAAIMERKKKEIGFVKQDFFGKF